MTNSELFTLMASGMAHISGGMMVVYINYGADPVAVLTTCVMACPCSLYLAKLFLPETGKPETAGTVAHAQGEIAVRQRHRRRRRRHDRRLAAGAQRRRHADRLHRLRRHVRRAAGGSSRSCSGWAFRQTPGRLARRSVAGKVFGWLFSPAAFLMGVEPNDVQKVGSLLGAKLAINEHYAYLQMKGWKATPDFMTRAFLQAGGLRPDRLRQLRLGRHPARRHRRHGARTPARPGAAGMRALFVGFMATLLNAAIAGVFFSRRIIYDLRFMIESERPLPLIINHRS